MPRSFPLAALAMPYELSSATTSEPVAKTAFQPGWRKAAGDLATALRDASDEDILANLTDIASLLTGRDVARESAAPAFRKVVAGDGVDRSAFRTALVHRFRHPTESRS